MDVDKLYRWLVSEVVDKGRYFSESAALDAKAFLADALGQTPPAVAPVSPTAVADAQAAAQAATVDNPHVDVPPPPAPPVAPEVSN